MDTKIIGFDKVDEAVCSLGKGEAVCFPTETVYGIGVRSDSEPSFRHLVELKKRPPEKPFTLMVSSLADVARFGYVDSKIISLLHSFMPGPLTVLLKARPNLPSYLTLGEETIGLRFPDDERVCSLIEKAGVPLLVPSANPSGLPPALNCKEAFDYFKGKVEYVIDGHCGATSPSTIVDLSKEGELSLVREGGISESELRKSFVNEEKTIALASDHGGFALKEAIKRHLGEIGFPYLDFGTDALNSCDYPQFAASAASAVAQGKADLAIICCTSGEGVCMAANKVKGVRCGIGYDDVVTGKCREHNDANAITFGEKYMKEEDVLRRVDIFLTERFSPLQKHHRRVKQLSQIEDKR